MQKSLSVVQGWVWGGRVRAVDRDEGRQSTGGQVGGVRGVGRLGGQGSFGAGSWVARVAGARGTQGTRETKWTGGAVVARGGCSCCMCDPLSPVAGAFVVFGFGS